MTKAKNMTTLSRPIIKPAKVDFCAAFETCFCPSVVALVPVRTDARWFQDYCLGREIHFIRGRLKFGGSTSNAPFGCCVVVFRPSLNDVDWQGGRP